MTPKKRGIGVRSLIRVREGTNLGVLTWKLRDSDPIGSPLTLISGEMRGVITKVNKRDSGDWTRFLNHSCGPNASIIFGVYQGSPTATVITTECIQPMQELTIDYGGKYLYKLDSWTCLCKSSTLTCKYLHYESGEGEEEEPLPPVTKGSPIMYRCEKERPSCNYLGDSLTMSGFSGSVSRLA
ncbi:hypothetical protein TESG_00762 [Trichophyton tonsurans CBS 112818]|uniref:SET domain-containing protein n=1 Tax=Trichophyton tonsurans (strain CBS 112818) TaxID=647933 RepID=F2RPF7_TRIT1|nr:hypothetical protein TESG_00762 [Trichophyton tonsurans CBS 112818]